MVRPKKHLGQHFLTDPAVANRIASSLNYDAGDNILEIGPGKGILTKEILSKENIRLKVMEIDPDSIVYLQEHFPNLEILHQDFLKADVANVFEGQEFKVIGNYPYNISSQIVFSVLENRKIIPEMSGMFQKEVAKRICADPGNKDYGILSVLSQWLYETKYLFTVNEGVFFPPPKVKSGVIRMTRREKEVDVKSYTIMSQLVKMAFNQRRKQIRNSIKSLLPPDFSSEYLSLRPEQLHFKDFEALLNQIHQSS